LFQRFGDPYGCRSAKDGARANTVFKGQGSEYIFTKQHGELLS